jgi:hypothetical protein
MLKTTLGNLMINEALPEDMRDYTRTLDSGGIKQLFQDVAERHPDKYREIAKRLSDVGRDAAYATGGYSASLEDLRPTKAGERIKAQIRRQVQMIQADNRMDDERKSQAIIAAVGDRTDEMQHVVFEEAKAAGNPLARQVLSGARGSKLAVKSLLGSDLLYADHHDREIPVPILNAYPHGLSPVEYWASAFGARKGVAATKFSTQEAGFLAKQLNQISHRLVVTGRDGPEDDTTSIRGLPTTADDPDNEGALLARDAGPYKRNTVLLPKVLKDLQARGLNRILVRSPLVGGPPQGGVYARDVGVRERGGLAPLGDYVGLAASQALSEKLSQGQLCLDEDTEVLLADGRVLPIKDIMVGDLVVGWEIGPLPRSLGRPIAVVVTAVHDNGERDCVRYHFGDRSVVATPDHKAFGFRFDPESGPVEAAAPLRDYGDGTLAVITVPEWLCTQENRERKARGELPVRPDGTAEEITAHVRLPAEPGSVPAPEPVGPRRTRDLAVAHKDHLFVLACGLIVSNSARHTGGVAGADKAVSGFAHINQLIQVPKTFKGGASHAQVDGKVASIVAAPQGGRYITVGDQQHYVPHGLDPIVKAGDTVEAGDVLSQGIPNPAEIVQHKGIGEGRRHFVDSFTNAFRTAGMGAHRRNVELLARGLIDHVRVTDEFGDHVEDDVVPYSSIEKDWTPRKGSQVVGLSAAVGKYLERPVLHHTIGTRIRPKMLPELKEFGVNNLEVHDQPPPFEPTMVRGMYNLQHDPDWMTRHLGSGLEKATLEAAHRGSSSDVAGTSYVPALAERTHFGHQGLTQGWHPDRVWDDEDDDDDMPRLHPKTPAAPRLGSLKDST